jgi:hypothetical protein
MTEKVYIIGIFTLAALVVYLVLMVKKGKGKITAKIGDKNVGLSFGAEAAKDDRMKQIADYMGEKLCTVRQIYRTDFLRLIKESGVDEALLMQIDDSRFVDQMLGNIVFSGNGIKSIKSIIEKVFLSGQFLSMKPDRLREMLSESIVENARIYTNDHYFNDVILGDGNHVRRCVSQTDWVDAQTKIIPLVMEKVDDIMSYARGLYEKEKE